MPESPNKDRIREVIEGACNGQLDGFLGLLHPEVEVHEPSYLPYGGHYEGVDAVLPVMAEAAKVVDFPTLKLHSITADEDRVALVETVKLLGTGEEVRVSEHWQLVDGLIRQIDVFWSSLPPV
jgi:ketosteroid isomerase-like protein